MTGQHRYPPAPRRHHRATGPLLFAALTALGAGVVGAGESTGRAVSVHPKTIAPAVAMGTLPGLVVETVAAETQPSEAIARVTSTFARRSFVVTKALPHTVTTQAPVVTPSATTAAATGTLAPTTPAVTTTAPTVTATTTTTTAPTSTTTTADTTTATPTTTTAPTTDTATATAEVTATLEATP